MKEILVVSDTHRNYEMLQQVIDSNLHVGVIIHLGDNYEDLDSCVYNRRGRKVYRVPGLFHPEYRNGILPHVLEFEIEGRKFIIAHSPDDLDHSADVLLFGHTHNWECSNSIFGKLFNPGHLRAQKDKGRIATYGIITLGNTMKFKIFTYKNELLLEAKV